MPTQETLYYALLVVYSILWVAYVYTLLQPQAVKDSYEKFKATTCVIVICLLKILTLTLLVILEGDVSAKGWFGLMMGVNFIMILLETRNNNWFNKQLKNLKKKCKSFLNKLKNLQIAPAPAPGIA